MGRRCCHCRCCCAAESEATKLLQEEITNYQSQIAKLNSDLASLQSQLTTAQSETTKFKDQYDQVQSDLTAQLTESTTQNDDLQQQIMDLNATLATERQKAQEQVKANLEKVKADIQSEAQQERAAAVVRTPSMPNCREEDAIATLTNDLGASQKQIEVIQLEMEVLQSKVDEAAELNSYNTQLQKELDAARPISPRRRLLWKLK
ncbi:hypothetical protein QTG54_015460 [Skeletonema marinoi]|uniref:Uncharacterized protein n=1 Tax=Skeletonema marinoi TaxID=267567 RepID=A0AAD9D5S0_9STRA|nr:hypothetical protein QTG54_015460 [Skeletonema marinoi]